MTSAALILAQSTYQNRFNGLRNAFVPDQSGSTDLFWIFVFFGAIITPIIVIAIVRKMKSPGGSLTARRPMRLFSRSMREMGVRFADRLLMRHIASRSRLRQPTVMLFSEELFERFTHKWLETLPLDVLREKAEARLGHVAMQAFGETSRPFQPPTLDSHSPEYAA